MCSSDLLHCGRGVLREAAYGVLCYFSAIPLMLIGVTILTVYSQIASAQPGQHPDTELQVGADWFRLALIALSNAVAAPIIEEIMFRGALYSHLRGTVFKRIPVVSILVSAITSSFIFAVIHPQGMLFIPALGGMAVSYCLYRELRGSLIASMVAHGIHNGTLFVFSITLIS